MASDNAAAAADNDFADSESEAKADADFDATCTRVERAAGAAREAKELGALLRKLYDSLGPSAAEVGAVLGPKGLRARELQATVAKQFGIQFGDEALPGLLAELDVDRDGRVSAGDFLAAARSGDAAGAARTELAGAGPLGRGTLPGH